MKRKIALLIAAMLAAGTVWMSAVSAAGPLLSASDGSANVGDTVTITVSISQNPGINWSSFYVQYDSSKLQLVSAQNGEVMNSWDSYSASQANGSYLVTTHTSTTKNTSKDGTMAVLTFKVLDSAAGSECVVSLSPKECYTDTGTSIEKVGVSTVNGTITVSDSESSDSSSGGQTDGNENQSGSGSAGTSGGSSSENAHVSNNGQNTSNDSSASGNGSIHIGSNDGNSSGTSSGTVGQTGNNGTENSSSDGWILTGDNWYYLTNGYYATGWKKIDNVWYYFDSKGIMQTGWQKVDGLWYYMKPWGGMATSWQKIDGVWYYLTGSGAMKTGWLQTGGKWYYLSGSGAMKTGWVEWKGDWYYMDSSGAMLTNSITPDGYYVDQDGIWEN